MSPNTEATILDRLGRIESALPIPEYEGVGFVAKKLNVSESYLRNHRPCQPNFGISDVPGKILWHLELINEWIKVPPRERQRQFENLEPKQKKQIVLSWKST